MCNSHDLQYSLPNTHTHILTHVQCSEPVRNASAMPSISFCRTLNPIDICGSLLQSLHQVESKDLLPLKAQVHLHYRPNIELQRSL